MPQNKRKRIGTSSSNSAAGENVESYTAAKKRGIATIITSKNSDNLLVEEKSDENSGNQSSEEEKGDESENNVNNTNSSEKETDDESDGDKSGGEEKGDESESESEESVEKEEEDLESSPDHVKIISNGTYKFETHLIVSGSYDSRINARVGFGVQFVEFRKILIPQKIENDFKKSCFVHFLKLDKDVAV
ncbi:probable methyltransferase PMT25 [Solanum lycopersicum]|uniref:probable methyltransferase PMT25 n=1 Tax=Solanum lycopersicum TaxID=4081 RepID=UPI003749BA21